MNFYSLMLARKREIHLVLQIPLMLLGQLRLVSLAGMSRVYSQLDVMARISTPLPCLRIRSSSQPVMTTASLICTETHFSKDTKVTCTEGIQSMLHISSSQMTANICSRLEGRIRLLFSGEKNDEIFDRLIVHSLI